MNRGRIFRSIEEDSTPWPLSGTLAEPVLAACPIPLAASGMCPVGIELPYLLAYESALRSVRPSRYERASNVSLN